jgi:Uma2 family endonuclease
MSPTAIFPDAIITGELLAHLTVPLPEGYTRYELVEGRIIPMTPNNRRHAEVLAELVRLLGRVPGWRVLAGDPGVYLRRRPDTVRAPDLLLISEVRYRESDPASAFLAVAPELVVEIVSPSNEREAMTRKVADYLAIGSTVWVIDVDAETVTVSSPGTPTTRVERLTAPNGTAVAVWALFAPSDH